MSYNLLLSVIIILTVTKTNLKMLYCNVHWISNAAIKRGLPRLGTELVLSNNLSLKLKMTTDVFICYSISKESHFLPIAICPHPQETT